MKTMRSGVWLAGLIALWAVAAGGQEDLLGALPKAKRSLEDGIRQLTKGDEVAISGKFEMEEGHLSLSIYTVEKGLAVDPERNVLKESAGSPEGAEWKPNAEVFKDVPHVARSSMQLTLMSMSKFSLLDILAKARKDQAGTPYSITPLLRDRKPVFVVLVANEGKSMELCYDLMTGTLADGKHGKVIVIPAKAHSEATEGAYSVEFGCLAVDFGYFELSGPRPERIEWVNAQGEAVDALAVSGAKGKLQEGFGRPVELRIYPQR